MSTCIFRVDTQADYLYSPVIVSHIPGEFVTEHTLNTLAHRVHQANQKWWRDLITDEPIQRNVGELLMLTVTELAEALEGHRKSLQDEKLPHRSAFEVELADAIIRLLDICGGMALDIGGAFEEKMQYNSVRLDHTTAHRLSSQGKKY